MKFGGSSVGTPESISNVKAIVERAGRPAVVVVSALGGVAWNSSAPRVRLPPATPRGGEPCRSSKHATSTWWSAWWRRGGARPWRPT